jgi:hypothetical protein
VRISLEVPIIITQQNFQAALDYLVSIEPDPNAIQSIDQYNSLMAIHKSGIDAANSTIRDYGMQIAPKGLPFMQGELQFVLSQQNEPLAISVIKAAVNRDWDGCGAWRQ